MYNLLNMVNSKYDLQLANIDEILLDKSVYETIQLLRDSNKKQTLDRVSVKYSGVASGLTSARNINYAYTSDGIAIKVGTKLDDQLSDSGIFSRPLFSNTGYLDDNGSFITKYTGTLHASYIPANGYYTYNSGLVNNLPENMYNILSSVYAKNAVIAVISESYSTVDSDRELIKQYLEQRLASDDVEVASGYANELGIDIQAMQTIIPAYDALIKTIVQNIKAELEELQ